MEHKDYSAIRWQADHGISHALTARLFGRSESSIPVIAWRDANRLIPHKVEDILHDTSAAGMAADQLLKDVKIEKDDLEVPLKLTELEQQIDAFGRHLYVADRSSNWEKAFVLMEYALKTWPKDDIHKSLNVNWAAASGLSSDSSEGTRQALKLLRDNAELSRGYLHPQTVTEMLLMTPQLPRKLRPEWVRFSLHYNAFRNK